MKKGIKVCLIVGGVFILAGTGVCIAAVAMGADLRVWGNHSFRWSDDFELSEDVKMQDLTEADSYTFQNIKKLDISMDIGDVEILDGEAGGDILVEIDDEFGYTKCYEDNGELKLASKGTRSRNFYRNRNTPYVQVTIPLDYRFEDVEIEMGAARCIIESLRTAELNVECGVGQIEIHDGQAGSLDGGSGVGSVVYKGSVEGDISISAGVGKAELYLTGVKQDYNYRLDAAVGMIHIDGDSYSGLGRSKNISNNAPNTIDIECGVGSVSVYFEEN